MFATAVPGLGPMVSRELGRLDGVVARDSGFDGRSDVVLFEAEPASRSAVVDLGLAEDVFVEVGRTLRSDADRPGWIAGRVWRPEFGVGASVANLPFGQRYGVQGDPHDWLRSVLGELARVTRPGGRVVLLHPRLPHSAVPGTLRMRDRVPIRLLGRGTTVWVYDGTG
jgi:hypothetical protein